MGKGMNHEVIAWGLAMKDAQDSSERKMENAISTAFQTQEKRKKNV